VGRLSVHADFEVSERGIVTTTRNRHCVGNASGDTCGDVETQLFVNAKGDLVVTAVSYTRAAEAPPVLTATIMAIFPRVTN